MKMVCRKWGRAREFVKGYHPFVWVLIGGTLFARLASSMSVPYIALYLTKKMDIQPFWVGVIVGVGALAGTFGGFAGGNLSDRFGRKKMMLGTLVVWGAVFCGFALVESAWLFLILNLLNGLCRSFFEPSAQAMIADLTPEEKRMRVFSIRYLAIHIGTAIGPGIGAALALLSASLIFWTTGFMYWIYAGLLIVLMMRIQVKETVDGSKPPTGLADAFRVLMRDRILQFAILGGMLAFVGYSQIETNLPLMLSQDLPGQNLYPVIITLNAVLIIALQMFLIQWAEKRPLIYSMITGAGLMAAGLFCFAAGGHWSVYVCGIFILTVGEILLLPVGGMYIDSLAPQRLRATYYGANMFRQLGLFAGPMLGGWLMERLGGRWAFVLIALITASAMIFYWLGHWAAQKEVSREKNWRLKRIPSP